MTICIVGEFGKAANKGLILCSDWMASTPLGSSETSFKQHYLPHDWYALSAGSESDILSLVSLVKDEFVAAKNINETNAQSLIRSAIQKRKNHKADEYISSRFGIGYKDFVDYGKTKFPDEMFRSAFAEVSQIGIGAELILAGFDDIGFPLICEAGGDGAVHIRENFATIGEGSYLSTASLRHREYISTMELERAVYCIYEAKRYAERVGSVGKYTSLKILMKDITPKKVSQKGVKFLDSEFKKYGPQTVPLISFEEGVLE